MKTRKHLLIIGLLSTVLTLGVSISINQRKQPIEVEAAQHISNYDNYTYSGTYYSNIGSNLTDGLDGTLRTSLTTLTYPKAWYDYSDDLPSMLPQIDADPTNSSNMVLFYSRDSVSKSTSTSTWNKEHVWPRSKSDNHFQYNGAGCDLLHIRPTYTDTNSKRGSLMIGDVADSNAVYYSNMLYGYCVNNSKFEPIDAVKGDVARIFMYLWTAYRGQYSLNMLNVIESYDTLLSWHTLDKPDALEGNRNNYAQNSNQKNRNPFVDHPEYAWRIFGDSASASVKNACMTAYPSNGSSVDPIPATGISVSPTSLNLEVGQTGNLTATLTPSNATNTVIWSSSNTNVATVSQSGVVTAVSAGTTTITGEASSTIKATCSVTVTASSTPANSFEKASSIAVGDVMYLACSDASKQYAGPSTTSTIYGLGADYTNSPDTSGIAFDVVQGSSNNTFAFKIKTGNYADKFLYWTSGNSLATSDSISSNSSWNVSFSGDNATIANVKDSSRIIWWNKSSPRFACYAVTAPGSTYYYVQLWKLTSSTPTPDPDPVPTDYLTNAVSLATLHGDDNSSVQTYSGSITFADLGLTSGQQYSDPFNIVEGKVTITFSGGENDGKYYDGGTGIRTYGGGSIAVNSSDGDITEIIYTWDGSNKPTSDVANPSGYSTSTLKWTGSSETVVLTRPSGSGHWRLQSVSVTCSKATVSVNDVAIRFGAKIPEADWS